MRLPKSVLDVVRGASGAALAVAMGCSSSATPQAPAAHLEPVVEHAPPAPAPTPPPPAAVLVAAPPVAPQAPVPTPLVAETEPSRPTRGHHLTAAQQRAALRALHATTPPQGDPLAPGTIGTGNQIGPGNMAGCGRG